MEVEKKELAQLSVKGLVFKGRGKKSGGERK